MSYTPTNWQCGDVVTAEKLNKLEQGVANCGGGTERLTVTKTKTGNIHALDKTWQEISDAFPNVQFVTSDGGTIQQTIASVASLSAIPIYNVMIGSQRYETSSPNGYPSYEEAPQ